MYLDLNVHVHVQWRCLHFAAEHGSFDVVSRHRSPWQPASRGCAHRQLRDRAAGARSAQPRLPQAIGSHRVDRHL